MRQKSCYPISFHPVRDDTFVAGKFYIEYATTYGV